MFALRPQQPALHDENAGAGLLRSFRDKENGPAGAGLGNSKPLFGKASTTSLLGGKLNQSSAPLGTRKALGNITNTNGGSDPSENMGGKLLGKGAAVKPEGRRAFGDLTNSALSASTRPAPAKPSLSLNQSLKPATQVSAKSAVQPPQSKAEKLAAGGIERLAGKSWAQMEAERVASQEKNLQQKVGILKSAIASWGMTSSLKVRGLWCAVLRLLFLLDWVVALLLEQGPGPSFDKATKHTCLHMC